MDRAFTGTALNRSFLVAPPGASQEHPRSTKEHPNPFKLNGLNLFNASKMEPKC